MSKNLAYIRVSHNKQDVKNQRYEILEASRLKDLKIDEAMQRLEEGDALIVTELSRLGRNTAEIIALVNELLKRGIRLIAFNTQGPTVTIFASILAQPSASRAELVLPVFAKKGCNVLPKQLSA
ncbi:recombinase family protein [Tengunoibacter tsumagoiensis]|uniref:Resolvase/invertase-type recombinase catalytic domain-containing protein n=1 Tax=Tengunoibacter tsumagoiensis TaxID=2014871 RepID=A0A402A892_9CHLR|nr:recombinase family protein [Tengunoibacter tsumagoiensis]GCE15363.1 hypothetical protein KTT_52220 [Tengunoibacter tsumagoiensis]